jgi:hypothetical protein
MSQIAARISLDVLWLVILGWWLFIIASALMVWSKEKRSEKEAREENQTQLQNEVGEDGVVQGEENVKRFVTLDGEILPYPYEGGMRLKK